MEEEGLVAVLTGDGRVLFADPRGGELEIRRSIPLPPSAVRIVDGGTTLIAGGLGGFYRVDPFSGEAERFCSTPLESRWAFVVTPRAVFFGSGPHLMKAPR